MPTPEQEKRIGFGLMVQPFVAASLALALFPLIEYTGRFVYGGRSSNFLDAAIPFAVLTGVAASFVTGCLAYPLLTWLLKRGPLTLRQTLLGGVALGNVPAGLLLVALAAWRLTRGETPTLASLAYGPAGLLRIIGLGSTLGILSAAVFWWIGGRYVSRT